MKKLSKLRNQKLLAPGENPATLILKKVHNVSS